MAYHQIQLAARGALEGVLAAISSHLLERHLPHLAGVLVTSDYGPRLYLATVLLDLDLPSAEPFESDGCADYRACVEVCPGGCIAGRP